MSSIRDEAALFLVDFLAKAGTDVPKTKLSMATLRELTAHPQREDIRKWVFVDDNLEGLRGRA